MPRLAEVAFARERTMFVFTPTNARARKPDAGVVLAAGRDSHMRATAANGYTYAAPGEIETDARENLYPTLKSQAHFTFPSARFHRAGAFFAARG